MGRPAGLATEMARWRASSLRADCCHCGWQIALHLAHTAAEVGLEQVSDTQ